MGGIAACWRKISDFRRIYCAPRIFVTDFFDETNFLTWGPNLKHGKMKGGPELMWSAFLFCSIQKNMSARHASFFSTPDRSRWSHHSESSPFPFAHPNRHALLFFFFFFTASLSVSATSTPWRWWQFIVTRRWTSHSNCIIIWCVMCSGNHYKPSRSSRLNDRSEAL